MIKFTSDWCWTDDTVTWKWHLKLWVNIFLTKVTTNHFFFSRCTTNHFYTPYTYLLYKKLILHFKLLFWTKLLHFKLSSEHPVKEILTREIISLENEANFLIWLPIKFWQAMCLPSTRSFWITEQILLVCCSGHR